MVNSRAVAARLVQPAALSDTQGVNKKTVLYDASKEDPANAPAASRLRFFDAQVAMVEKAYEYYEAADDVAAIKLLCEVIYQHVNPGKTVEVPKLMERYAGNKLALLKDITKKY